jgi:DNA-binding CsgD family transcriptional regulator
MRVLDEFAGRDARRVHVPGRGLVRLSRREAEALELRQGLPTNVIARRLSVAQVTVRTYVATMLRKLDVKSREEAVRLLESDRSATLSHTDSRARARCSWRSRTQAAPSPTADATRFVDARRTSPTAKTPGIVDSY